MWICVCFRNQGNRNHLRKRRGWNTLIHCINSFSCSAEQPSQKSGGFSDMLFEIQGSSKYEIFSAPTQLSWYFDKQLHKKIGYPCIRPQSTLGSTVPVGPLTWESLSQSCNKKSLNVCIPCCSKLDEDNLYMAYADIMAKVSSTEYQYSQPSHCLKVN